MPRAETVLSWALAFVVGWFGVHEIVQPAEWVTFAPAFLGQGMVVTDLVVLHGAILTISALLLITNVYRRFAAGVLALVFLEVIAGLIAGSGLSDIAVRDIGLCGMSLGLAILTWNRR